MKSARTTVTLEPDVAEKLKGEMHRTGATFKQTVNNVLRRGLSAKTGKPTGKPFRVNARDMRLKPGLSYEKVWELVDRLDGPSWP